MSSSTLKLNLELTFLQSLLRKLGGMGGLLFEIPTWSGQHSVALHEPLEKPQVQKAVNFVIRVYKRN